MSLKEQFDKILTEGDKLIDIVKDISNNKMLDSKEWKEVQKDLTKAKEHWVAGNGRIMVSHKTGDKLEKLGWKYLGEGDDGIINFWQKGKITIAINSESDYEITIVKKYKTKDYPK
jgi:hypothetical protein